MVTANHALQLTLNVICNLRRCNFEFYYTKEEDKDERAAKVGGGGQMMQGDGKVSAQ